MGMDLEAERALARRYVQSFRLRLDDESNALLPTRLALKWQEIFESDEPSIDAVREVVTVTRFHKGRFEIVFWEFCIHVEGTLRQMMKESCASGAD
jgi:hypothetical protein